MTPPWEGFAKMSQHVKVSQPESLEGNSWQSKNCFSASAAITKYNTILACMIGCTLERNQYHNMPISIYNYQVHASTTTS